MNILETTSLSPTYYECRCCLESTKSYIKVEKLIENIDIEVQTYREIWEKLTNFEIPHSKKNILPQQICLECCKQLINSYKFIQQICNVAHYYLSIEYVEENVEEDISEKLQESFMELTEIVPENSFRQDQIEKHSDNESNVEIIAELEDSVNNFSDNLKDYKSDESSSSSSKFSIRKNATESLSECDFSKITLPIICDICQKQFRNENSLIHHKRYTHKSDLYKKPCPFCNLKAHRPSRLRHHIKIMHGPDKLNEYFKITKTKGSILSCDICSLSYSRKENLHKHIEDKHKKKTTEDGKEIDEGPVKPKERYLCTYCGRSYLSNNSLKTHLRTHTGERPYVCDICNKTFISLKTLRSHKVVHSDEKPFVCTTCGKGFKWPVALREHNRVHSEERPFKCDKCGKTFRYNSILKAHMFVHTREVPHSCKTCGAAFSFRHILNKHCQRKGHEK